jgi:uncharacterized protein (DUF1499 family)
MTETARSSGSGGQISSRWGRRIATVGVVLAVVCVLAAMFSGFGYQMGLWHFRTGFLILRWAFFGALAAAVISLVGLVLGRFARAAALPGITGLVIALAFAYVPWQWKQTLDSVPYIHDITTDTENPPEFVAAVTLRKEGDHPVAYDGEEVAAEQKKAYPDLAPMLVQAPREQAFEGAKAAVAAMGLQLNDANAAEGRIEASYTSFWYGFTDDMVVRIAETPEGTRVDVRSKSRVGRSDLGQNAKRIRVFLARLKAELG